MSSSFSLIINNESFGIKPSQFLMASVDMLAKSFCSCTLFAYGTRVLDVVMLISEVPIKPRLSF